MKIFYLLTKDADTTVKQMMQEQKKQHDIEMTDLRKEKNFRKVIQQIVEADHVISW